MRWVLTVLMTLGAMLGAGPGAAQTPQVNVTTEGSEVLVGQPIRVLVEVLVPTFMPRAPIFPSFEAPGVLVRLPERSTQPVSERIGGTTWSGVRRTYRVYPMSAGVIDLPPQKIEIVYRDAEINADVPLSVDVPPMRFRAVVPPAARGLDPLILADGITVAQDWSGADGTLAVGDAVTRQLFVTVSGTSALFVPDLLGAAAPEPGAPSGEEATEAATFARYPEDAVVTEEIERGVMSGTRSEQVSYIAQSGGETRFPDIVLTWYDIGSGTVEEIRLPGRIVSVAPPPRTRQPLDAADVLRAALVVLFVCGLVWAGNRWLWPRLRAARQSLSARYAGSLHAAHRRAEARARARDLNGVLNALELRKHRGLAPGEALRASLDALSRARYRAGAEDRATDAQWVAVERALRRERPPLVPRRSRDIAALPALNPFSSPRS